LLILVAAVGLFAWQQGGGDGPLNAIAKAAEKTQDQPGGRAVMRSVVTVAGQPLLTMTGRFVFDSENRTQGVITAPQTRSGGQLRENLVGDGTVMYVHSSQLGPLPGGRKWMSVDLALGEELNTSVGASADAKGELALLESVSDDPQRLGEESVRGVPTTHFRGTISVASQADRLREEGGDAAASLVEKDGSPLLVEAWIDAEGLLRRMRILRTQAASEGKKEPTIDMRVDFFDFGFEPEIQVPDPDEVFDATARVRREAGVPSGELQQIR
jgi:hypothetical protein